MDKQIITFTANEQCLRKTGGLEIFASKTVSYIEAHFDLGDNWSGYDSVRAVWWNDYTAPISTVLDAEGVCIVPPEVLLRKCVVFVNLVGSISENDVLTDRLTTIPITALTVKFNAHVNSTETAPITPSQFEQFVSIVQDAVASIKDIVSATLNADYTLTFVYSDGTSYTTPSIRGERGPQGADGADGTDGNGIASAVLNSNYTLTLTFTDGTSYTTPSIRGAQGPKGDPGDVSQAQLDAAVSDLKSDLSNARVDTGIPIVTFNEVVGKYIYNNEEKSSGAFNHSEPIAVSKGDIVSFTGTGYLTYVSMIALSNAEGTSFTSVVDSIDSTRHTYEYTVLTDGYIVVSYSKSSAHNLVIKNANSNIALGNRIAILENQNTDLLVADADMVVVANHTTATVLEAGKFINSSGVKLSSGGFSIFNQISLTKGQTLTFKATGYLTNVAVLARVNADSTFTPLIISPDSSAHQFTYLARQDVNVVISSSNNTVPIYSVVKTRIGTDAIRIDELERSSFAFATMGIIGDSLASGASNYSGGASDRPNYSWGKYIEREHGINVSLFSKGGGTTRSWLSESWGLTALQNADVLDLYVIGLGVNDAYSLGADYLGTVADVHVGSENLNADTYYGNYSKIIASIKAKSPRAKIICLTNPKGTGTVSSAYNQAVRDIVALYTNTYLIDLINDSFYTSTEFNATWNAAHSTALGYKLIAENIYKNISELIKGNVSEFLDIQWIIENHA